MREDQERGGNRRGSADPGDPITERLIDEGDRSPEGITAAAREGFEQDQRNDPHHPTRTKREMAEASGVEDPAHSRGSESGRPSTTGSDSGGSAHGNRDRSDLQGSPARPAEETGEVGSGRSASTAPSEGRDTRAKESEG